jgi:PHS family inorganic phosphate transporter-like MFS transporter
MALMTRRYTLDILQNTKSTLEDTANYFGAPELNPERGEVEMIHPPNNLGNQEAISRRSSSSSGIAPDEIIDSDSDSEHRPSGVHLRPDASSTPQLPPGDPSLVPPLASWADAKNFFITEGNWQYLLGTSLAWLFLDFACKCSSCLGPTTSTHAH